jgi:hypothetical protein
MSMISNFATAADANVAVHGGPAGPWPELRRRPCLARLFLVSDENVSDDAEIGHGSDAGAGSSEGAGPSAGGSQSSLWH